MSAVAAMPDRLDLGRVFRDLFGVLRRNFWNYLILALILSGIPAALLGLLTLNIERTGELGPGFLLSGLVSLITGVILQGALVYGAVNDMNGRRVSVGESLRTGLSAFLPLVGIGLLYGLAVFVGMLLLVVPGVIIAIVWSVAVPAFVAERTDLLDAFRRSAELTRGNRWRILGAFLLYLLLLIAVALPFVILASVVDAIVGGASTETFRALVLNPVNSAVSALLGAAMAAVLYVELRRIKDGIDPEGLASAFD